ncbi:hypothetical protein Q9299_15955 [Gemmobacter fulvus]|uniref:hypothetical protein n=1 Tax=Gemmobacter fulvus TaxID=2840474 RepID=UPI002796A323|nr:hypothetical protein [Gemmobacter fulvus]MDQ1849789.1 hypothetical protein [Gemmobacter fulvus]
MIEAALAGTLETASGSYAVEIIEKDTQSNPNRAGDMASDLIFQDEVDLVLVGSTPATTNPMADLCEWNRVLCISAAAPWQPWFSGAAASRVKRRSRSPTISSGAPKT